MKKLVADKISRAKSKLLVEYPYFGVLASKIDLHVNDDLESFLSDGKRIEFREEYLQDLKIEEIEFILANGAMHKALAHEHRKHNRSGWLWRMATDIAINDMLLQNGLKIPYGAQYRKRFSGMYAEEIYAELKSDILRDDENLEYEADESDDVNANDKKSQSQHNQVENSEATQEELLQEILDAQEAISLLENKFAKNAGNIPHSIERFFHIEPHGKINWREQLREALLEYFYDDYRLIPPSKKLLYAGVYLPSSSSNRFKLTIAIDSSGSIDDTLLNAFLTEVNFLMELVTNYEIDVVVCDTQVHTHQTFYAGEILELHVKGAGATDFRPVFEYIEENLHNTQLLLYFTDLEGTFPNKEPRYGVKWISPQVKEIPFGDLILLED